jgi:hypothetical protein
MSQALASSFPQPTRGLLAATLVGRRRPRNPFARRDWLRVSQRLACGMTPDAVARAEGKAPEAVRRLLEQPGFKGLVESFAELLEGPAEQYRARLVGLARLALENALMDWDAGTAVFVLDQDEKGLDPVETLVDAALAQARRPMPAGAPGPGGPAPHTLARRAGPGRYDALDGLARRSTARLRAAMLSEHALQHAGEPAAPPAPAAEPAPAAPASEAATAAAARHALALRQAAMAAGPVARPAAPIARLARRLADGAAGGALLSAGTAEPVRPRLAGLPRRPRGP